MKRKDYSKYILPTTLINNDSEKETISTDLIFIRTKEEIEESKFKLPDNYKDPISDFALYNGAYAKKDDAGNPNCPIGCRFLYYDGSIMVRDGNTFNFSYSFKCDALPAFNIKLPKKNSPILKSIRPYILNNETLFYTLELGENAQGLVSCELNNTLESLYNNGKLGEGLESTGLWVTTNAAEPNDYDNTFISRQNPEFIFQGQRYIRQAEPAFWKLVNDATLSNGEKLNKNDISAKWFKVEPVKYKILNWDKLPLYINPNGNGSDDRIELEALQVQISGLAYDMVWENSVARAFLSSSTLSSRNLNYSKSGFLYQTLNLKRQPIKEYAISKAESKVCEHAFDGCVQLEKIVLHEDLKSIGKTAFNGCNFKYVYKLKSSSDTIFAKIPPKNIKECQCFIDLEKLEKHCITPNINLVYFLLEDYSKILPHLEGDQKVFLYPSSDQGKEEMLEIFEVYRAKGYDYVYKIKGTADHIISKNPPTSDIFTEVIQISKMQKRLTNFHPKLLFFGANLMIFSDIIDKLEKADFNLPYEFVQALYINNDKEFADSKIDFSFFKSNIPNLTELLENATEEEKLDFCKFAKVLGCFSTDKMIDKNGLKTDSLIGQKASSVLLQILKSGIMPIGKYHSIFDCLDIRSRPSQDFIKFISQTEKKSMHNLQLLLELERENPGIFADIMTNFDKAKEYRRVLSDQGKPINLPWKEAFVKYHYSNAYTNITPESQDLATLFVKKGLSQELFDFAKTITQTAKKKKMPAHILSKHLKEESLLETLERKKEDTLNILQDSKSLLEELYEKQFTFEFLDKYDPHNGIIGLFCSCCASITSTAYGKDIAIATMQDPNVQNIVIRNAKDEIIAKGTIYVNKETGFAVINDFEINEIYKQHEKDEVGFYSVDEDSKQEKERELIFNAFMRAINAFVKEYDKQFPNNPIKKVNVGMGYNRLKRQCIKFKKETSINTEAMLEYSFKDAAKEQYILYDREESLKTENDFEKE